MSKNKNKKDNQKSIKSFQDIPMSAIYDYKRGEVYFVNIGETQGSEQSGTRPCVILQNNTANKFSNTLTVVCLSTKDSQGDLPTHVKVQSPGKVSYAKCEHLITIDKSRILNYFFTMSEEDMKNISKTVMDFLSL